MVDMEEHEAMMELCERNERIRLYQLNKDFDEKESSDI